MESTLPVWKKYLGYSVAVLAIIFAYSWITSPLIVSVTGIGEVSAPAQKATLTFTFSSNGNNPQEANSNLKSNILKMKQNLTPLGIIESDFFESQTSILPATSGGFQASTSMGINTDQVTNLDNIISNLYSNGAVVVTQPILSVGDIETLEKNAYNLAIKDAKKKAWNISFSNLKLIRKIVLIEQSTTDPTSTITSKADTVSQVEKNISPDDGLIKIKKVVSVSYKMW